MAAEFVGAAKACEYVCENLHTRVLEFKWTLSHFASEVGFRDYEVGVLTLEELKGITV